MRRQVDYDRFQAAIGWCAEAFGKELSAAIFEIYWEALRDLSWEAYRWAIATHIRDGKHFPRPAELRILSEQFFVSEQTKRYREEEALASSQLEREAEVWRKNPILLERDRARFHQVWNDHGDGHPGGKGTAGCGACAFERKHRAAHLHLANVLCAGAVDWANPIEGCCA